LKIGDTVVRILAGSCVMALQVTDLTEDIIHCGDWTFCRKTLMEVDEVLEWGPQWGFSGSYLMAEAA